MAQDTAPTKQRTEPAHQCTVAKWLKTPHAQHNAPGGAPVNRRHVAQDTAHAKQRTERAHR